MLDDFFFRSPAVVSLRWCPPLATFPVRRRSLSPPSPPPRAVNCALLIIATAPGVAGRANHLESHRTKFKFSFCHQVTSGDDPAPLGFKVLLDFVLFVKDSEIAS